MNLNTIKKLFALLFYTISPFFYSRQGQEQPQEMKTKEASVLNKPKIDIQVNKKYDEMGNLIYYDSTYSYFYASQKTDKFLTDNILNTFKPFLEENYPDLLNISIEQLFFNDSILQNDYFYDDYFQKRVELNHDNLEELMKKMDSIKKIFFEMQGKPLKN